mmetsp:Transcript_36431/g.27017  ORF Transcript_36431/g.27017 Transcript_36431/m.27017 type:complete len:101 (+) Transcript_36431:398-700(+)
MHRDLKPENIMIRHDFHLKIIDFGDANYIQSSEGETKDEEQKSSSSLKQNKGTFVGTVFYVSPEMLSDSVSTASCDLWALGCIIFRMYFGKVPFCGSNDY